MKRASIYSLLLAGGCYGYYPITSAAPVGDIVQATLTDSASVVLARQIGPSVTAVSGLVTADSASVLVLALTSTRQREGEETTWKGERLVLPRPLIASVEQRRFSAGRTGLFGGALAVALYAMRQAFGGTGASSGGSGLPTGTGPK